MLVVAGSLFGALVSVVVGHYVVGVTITTVAGGRLTGAVRPEDLAVVTAVFAIGLVWVGTRLGRSIRRDTVARGILIGAATLLLALA